MMLLPIISNLTHLLHNDFIYNLCYNVRLIISAKIIGRSTVVMAKLLINFFLKLNLTYMLVCQGEAQLMTDCNTTEYQLEPSQYQRVCCITNNLGQSFATQENGTRQYIFCLNEIPKSCRAPGIHTHEV